MLLRTIINKLQNCNKYEYKNKDNEIHKHNE